MKTIEDSINEAKHDLQTRADSSAERDGDYWRGFVAGINVSLDQIQNIETAVREYKEYHPTPTPNLDYSW